METLFGRDYFRGKSILELGCGNGLIGKHFRENLQANVTFAEGRESLHSTILDNNPGATVFHVDQDNLWHINQTFDVIIHWGVLYHLSNWKQDLECTVRHLNQGGILTLESEVMDSLDDKEIKCSEHKYDDDQALYGIGSRPSPLAIENQLSKLGLKFTRYDDADLNFDFHTYDWIAKNDDSFKHGQRRFWVTS